MMGLLDSLKKAEEQGRESAHRGMQRAGEMWEEAERRLRRKMRIHPRRSFEATATSSTSAAGPAEHKERAA
jgi:hypothetical protein